MDLPFDAARAKALEEGTEITLRGSGTVAANASIGLGYTLAQLGDLISVGATFGSSIGASKSLDLALRLKRLDGNKIFVSVNKVDTTAGSISLGAHAGVDLTLAKHLPDLGGGLLEKEGTWRPSKWRSRSRSGLSSTFEPPTPPPPAKVRSPTMSSTSPRPPVARPTTT